MVKVVNRRLTIDSQEALLFSMYGQNEYSHSSQNYNEDARRKHKRSRVQVEKRRCRAKQDTQRKRQTVEFHLMSFNTMIKTFHRIEKNIKKGKRKVQGVPQSQNAALPSAQEEEETDKSKQAQIEQTYEKH